MRALVVHGGAGAERADERKARRMGVQRAAEAGWSALRAGRSALDAVVAAVVVLENDPSFNAGLGSVLTEDGGVEMDASVMEGTALRAGAVGAVAGVVNPIKLARVLLEEGREVLRVGEPAAEAARAHGLVVVAPDAMIHERAHRRWLERRPAPGETVGAVACDGTSVAAATSTGGVAGKRRGRIGDSALIGAGTYADDRVGAGSATGPGEAIIRIGLVHRALDLIAAGATPAAAARAALDVLAQRIGAEAGLILLDPQGGVGVAHTTPAMPAAWVTYASGRVEVVG